MYSSSKDNTSEKDKPSKEVDLMNLNDIETSKTEVEDSKLNNDITKDDKGTPNEEETLVDSKEDSSSLAIKTNTEKIIHNILKVEERKVGHVSFKDKINFFRMRGGIYTLVIDFIFLIIMQVAGFGRQWMMQQWVSLDPREREIRDFL